MYKTRSRNIQRWIESGDGWKTRKKFDSSKTNKERAKKIKVGSLYTGIVIRILDIGAVVKIKGISSFLHISEISSEWVDHPSKFLSVRQNVNVWVISNETDNKGRISIKVTMKESPAKNGPASIGKKNKKIKKQKFQTNQTAYMWEYVAALKDMGVRFLKMQATGN